MFNFCKKGTTCGEGTGQSLKKEHSSCSMNQEKFLSPVGYSGMAQIDPNTYIVVHDIKGYKEGNRLGIIKVQKGKKPEYTPIKVSSCWKHPDGKSSDLESICKIPGHTSEFFAAESGYWEGKNGRLFHLELNGNSAEILNVYQLPLFKDNNRGQEGDNFEGMVCILLNNGQILVVLGERGGSSAYKTGGLRFGIFDYVQKSLIWESMEKGLTGVLAPGKWVKPGFKRDISDLYVSKDGGLWAVATEDDGDEGPFRSVIYKVATLDYSLENPVKLLTSTRISWIVDGVKIESLSGPCESVPGSYMSYATEDESFDGVWRALYPPIH